ncbi:MAG: type VI secretion system tube protein Hcp [Acidobacteria bacterium]|nr:type VI secretion system tube protein Hcp [Acidobacteriota bacterium]
MTNVTFHTVRRAAILVCCIAAGMLLANPAYSQSATSGNSNVVQVSSLNCSTAAGTNMFAVVSWSVGSQSVSNPRLTAGAAYGAANLAPLQVVKAFDSCSPALFGGSVAGTHLSTLTLTVSNSNKIRLLTIVLSEVTVSSYQLADAGPASEAAETVAFTYGRISITNYGPGGGSFCWDVPARRTCQ